MKNISKNAVKYLAIAAGQSLSHQISMMQPKPVMTMPVNATATIMPFKDTMKLFALLFALAVSAFAQAYRVDPSPVFTTNGGQKVGAFYPVMTVGGSQIALCTDATCASTATAYTGASGSTACPSNAPVVLASGGGCTAYADSVGNFGFWLVPGTYYYRVTYPNGNLYGPYPVTVASAGSVTAPLSLSVNSSSPTLSVTNTGAGQALVWSGNAGGDALTLSGALAANSLEASGTFRVDGSVVSTTHMQNVGATDAPTFYNQTVTNQLDASIVHATALLRFGSGTVIDSSGYRLVGGGGYFVDTSGNITANNLTVSGTCTGCASGVLAVPVTISGSSSSSALSVTNSGAGNGVTVSGGTATDKLSVTGQADISIVHGTTRFSLGSNTFVDSGGYRVIGGTAYVIDSSQNGAFAGISMSGSFTGTHAQNVGTADTPTHAGLTLSSSPVSTALLTITNGGSGNGATVSTAAGDAGSFTSYSGRGLLGIGTTYGILAQSTGATHSIQAVDTGGTCQVGTGVSGISCTSDRRAKKDISYRLSGLSVVMNLKPAQFRYKAEPVTVLHAGFIAQDVRSVAPDLVTEDTGGMLSLSQAGIIPYLVKAIQEQQKEIETLKKRLKY